MNKEKTLKKTLDEILDYIGVKPDIEIEEEAENILKVDISGTDLNFLIGFRGQSLDALQAILGLSLFRKTGEWSSVLVDINDYKDRRLEKIEEITRRFIDKVRFFQNNVSMPPMNPWERRQVHTLVGEYNDIVSESEGVGRSRRVVLKINGNDSNVISEDFEDFDEEVLEEQQN